jgi:glycosyltransferase involved in cell wall biosynthesis
VDGFGAFPGGDLARRLEIPTAWAIHESVPLASHWEMLQPEADPYVRQRAETALKSASAAVFEAEETRGRFACDLAGVPCVTVPHGVDVDALENAQRAIDRDGARARRDIPREAKVVLCTGTFSPPEEQAALVWAFARVADRHPGAVLVLVDELGPTDDAAVAMAVSACGLGEDRIRVEPLFADLPEAYAIADVAVCAPGGTWLPYGILEAMAVGLPVLGAATLGIPELIEDGVTGWLAEPGDVGALACALDRVLRLDESERLAVARAARARVRSAHDSRASARAWAYVLTRVAGRRPIHLPLRASFAQSRSA